MPFNKKKSEVFKFMNKSSLKKVGIQALCSNNKIVMNLKEKKLPKLTAAPNKGFMLPPEQMPLQPPVLECSPANFSMECSNIYENSQDRIEESIENESNNAIFLESPTAQHHILEEDEGLGLDDVTIGVDLSKQAQDETYDEEYLLEEDEGLGRETDITEQEDSSITEHILFEDDSGYDADPNIVTSEQDESSIVEEYLLEENDSENGEDSDTEEYEIEFYVSNNGKRNLLWCNGYDYHYDSSGTSNSYYRCVHKNKGCKGRLILGENSQVLKTNEQNHMGGEPKKALNCFRADLKRDAKQNVHKLPSAVISTAKVNATEEVVAASVGNKSLQAVIAYARKGLNEFPKEPDQNDHQFNLENEFCRTPNGQNIIQFDGFTQKGKRVILLATDSSLLVFSNSLLAIVDGTFFSAPKPFHQVFIIQGNVTNSGIQGSNYVTYPLIYALLQDKTQDTYTFMFKKIRELSEEKNGHSLQMKNLICDFELGISNAVKRIFPHVKITLCLFHFWKSLNKSVLKFKLAKSYRNLEANIASLVHTLIGIAHLPSIIIPEIFQMVKERELARLRPELAHVAVENFLSYFENTYASDQARYPPCDWSVFEMLMNELPRTQNANEQYNARLNRHFQKKPKFYRLIKQICKELQITMLDVEAVRLGRRLPERDEISLLAETSIRDKIVHYEEYINSGDNECIFDFVDALAVTINESRRKNVLRQRRLPQSGNVASEDATLTTAVP